MKIITIDELANEPDGTVFFEYNCKDELQCLRVIDKIGFAVLDEREIKQMIDVLGDALITRAAATIDR
jgi:hypothetical protein